MRLSFPLKYSLNSGALILQIPGKGEVEGDMLEIVHEAVDPPCSKHLGPLRWLSQLDLVFH